MATPVESIYRRFLSRIGADILSEIEDKEVVKEILLIFLEDAICEVEDIYKKDLTIANGNITSDLTSLEIKILANAMVLYWLQPKINTEEMIKMKVTDGDYTKKNTASLLDKLIKLRAVAKSSLRSDLVKLSWKNKRVNL
ncbi:MAG: hypothetical protein ACRCWM_08045 [Sarcina sp.]